MNTSINAAGLALIKKFESLHDGDLATIGLQPKMCPAGIWTIGWGRALTNAQGDFLRGPKGRSEAYAKYGSISEDQAEQSLKEDTAKFAEGVSNLLEVGVTSNQFSALVSLAYNIGLGALSRSTVLKRLNAGDVTGAAAAFLLWNKSGGKVLRGLTLRREAERQLFLTPDEGN
jgi:lysozyme